MQHCMSLLIANEVEENVTEGCLCILQMSFDRESLAEEKMGKCKQLINISFEVTMFLKDVAGICFYSPVSVLR